MKQRDKIGTVQHDWNKAVLLGKFRITTFYNLLNDDGHCVPWHSMIQHKARPRAIVCLWMACHGKLPTRERLRRFGMIQVSHCVLCGIEEESHDHLFFKCSKTESIWKEVLNWMEMDHRPQEWAKELEWLTIATKKKGWKASLLSMGIAETVYNIWRMRNSICFKDDVDNTCIFDRIKECIDRIKDSIVYRACHSTKLRHHIARIMM
ncbi:uncharacterized protein LOC131637519 [Vicia villosa]|uniref:uncharacterized protein LOC131637519 n=1 Tax=Vicia villosa TaxID=3911 RepID=UPI00273C6BE1|nr:uncharacterized protein LOC131637519 [Vicia villosa]